MKNYDEITNRLLERRDRYVSERKKKRKKTAGIAASFCCFAILIGFGAWQSGIFNPNMPDKELEDALYPGIKDYFDDSKGESADNNKIVINRVEKFVVNKMGIALLRDDFVEMSREEVIGYYGVNFVPEVPSDMKIEETASGIYRRGDGTGEVYWDTNNLNYANEDSTRNIILVENKGGNVFVDYDCFKGTEEKSVINNLELFIGLSEDGWYYTEFMYNNVGFLISAKGVTEDEFVSVIKSIIR